jgi:hypothetical protein
MIPVGIVVLFIGSAIPAGWADATTRPETQVLCANLRGSIEGWWDKGERWHVIEMKCIVKVAE